FCAPLHIGYISAAASRFARALQARSPYDRCGGAPDALAAAAIGIAALQIDRHSGVEAMGEAHAHGAGVAIEPAAERERGLPGLELNGDAADRRRCRNAAPRPLVDVADLGLQAVDL